MSSATARKRQPAAAASRSGAIQIERALGDRKLLGAALGDLSTWTTWIAVLKAAYGRRLTSAERTAFDRVAGGRQPPQSKVKELVVVVSRRGGKGRAAGALAAYEAAIVDHSAHLAPGELGVVCCISPTIQQARIVQRYALGFLQSSPVLRDEIAEITADEIRLRNGNVIATLASDFRTLRGRTLPAAILDEASFLRDKSSATPDIEAARALLPGLSTTNGMLVTLSSPYRRVGLVYQRHRDYFGKDNERVLVVAGPSLEFNPTLDVEMIASARAADPQAALAEWDGEFRSDLAQFLDDTLVDGAIDAQRPMEHAPRGDLVYAAFADLSGGRHDASTICIGHAEGEGDNRRYIADAIRGFRAPHDPAIAVKDFAALAKQYGINTIHGDNYSADWVSGAFTDAGVSYQRSELPRSALYLEGLPLFARGLVSIPDQPILIRELRLLERRTTRSGRDSVDHGSAGSDDYANALFGMLYQLSAKTGADGWIGWARGQAERAQLDEAQPVDDEQPQPFFLPGNPRAGLPPPPAPNNQQTATQQTNNNGAPPGCPEALKDNPISRTYFGTVHQLRQGGGVSGVKVAKCASCGASCGNTKITDHVTSWCGVACHAAWTKVRAEAIRAREVAINGGLPLKS